MGCVPSNELSERTNNSHQTSSTHPNIIFTIDERLKLKEVWIIIKQNGLKKLGDDIMNRALERNSTLKTYWQIVANHEKNTLLIFDETNLDFLWKECLQQHGYKLLEKIDQLIMIMVTHLSTNDQILNDYFTRIVTTHRQHQLRQDHIDIISESFLECVKNVMDQNGCEWTIKHALAWQKFFTLITTNFIDPTKITF